ncbi:tyrosine-type recombinase/integrase [Mycobacteroides abscessus]|uniref:tyrosine-type recombinase/integrase n=1 Tax=Mycobacteroides abscessus TaxID=36809 RepID=UPI0039EE37E8
MTNNDERGATGAEPASPLQRADPAWHQQWQQVPPLWRTLRYRIDAAPFNTVFAYNGRYLADPSGHDFTVADVPERFNQEMAWWVWLCGHEGIRKIEPAMFTWCGQAIAAATAEYRHQHRREPVSIADLPVETIVRAAVVRFERRNKRLPSPGVRRTVTGLIEGLHLYVSVRATTAPWWSFDMWDLQADPRIPRREHEPGHDKVIKLAAIEPVWLREGIRFWLRTAVSAELLRWSSAAARARDIGRHLGPFLTERTITEPFICPDRAQLRLIFTEFADYLNSPAAAARPGTRPSAHAVQSAQTQVQAFYTFMVDHADEAAAATGYPGWSQLTDTHTRLWGPAFRSRSTNAGRDLTWYSTSDLQQMLCYLDVLGADRGAPVAITHPDNTVSVIAGLGDPQAARIWLLQALTGRRASEILMLDFDPLQPIPGAERPLPESHDTADPADPDAFVAKLRYQQTKVDGVVPTILVEQAVVNIIAEQQAWLARRYPQMTPKYLFLGRRHHHQGARPRNYSSYSVALAALDRIHGLTDSTGKPLRFSQTHRLRHTRATELLNDGVPIHVVQRYLGHASPEMTLRYAATLAATAEAEFLRHKKIGAHGTDITISPADIYDMTQLAQRTDRVLPNGVCLLPPLKSCDKGNACLSCGHFATDATHLAELTDQRSKTLSLIEVRRQQFRERTGRDLTDDNVWVGQRRHEIASLNAIIERLNNDPAAGGDNSIGGAGPADRQPQMHNKTRGSHESVLRKADPGRHR